MAQFIRVLAESHRSSISEHQLTDEEAEIFRASELFQVFGSGTSRLIN